MIPVALKFDLGLSKLKGELPLFLCIVYMCVVIGVEFGEWELGTNYIPTMNDLNDDAEDRF